ncbi:MAG: hypothetical protein WC441_01215 [Patescibacteria group bacterium]
MEQTEVLSNRDLEKYLDKLISTFGLVLRRPDKALRIQHQHRLYAECIQELKRIMNIDAHIKLRVFPEKLWPHGKNSGRINFPKDLPFIASPEYKKVIFVIDIKEEYLRNYPQFIVVAVHELSHLLLFSLKHELRESELATDLCLFVFGFGPAIAEAYKGPARLGYLSERQFQHALKYVETKHQATQKKEPKRKFWQGWF